jgi:Zn-dependent protease
VSSFLLDLLLAGVPIIVAITLHEAAHGYAASALGDDTARLMGRLSLNPLRHVDRVGTLLVPGALVLGQLLTVGHVGFVFGWAKPVPVDPRHFRDPRRGMALVAAAGPAANAVLAWLGALGWRAVQGMKGEAADYLGSMLYLFILSNLVLGLFNLLPIPPLDGGRIAVGVLPLRLARIWARLERAGLAIVLLVVFLLPRLSAEFGTRIDPVNSVLGYVMPWALHIVARLSGNDALPWI